MRDASPTVCKNEDREEKSGPIEVSWKKSMMIISMIKRSLNEISYFSLSFSG